MAVSEAVPSTAYRASNSTSAEINEAIRQDTELRVRALARADLAAINRRLEQLDHEWDIERTLEANAAGVSLLGIVLGSSVDRRFYLLSGVVAGFLFQHAVQGWCPPLPIFRRLGIRTAREIEHERVALKALRGDFDQVDRDSSDAGQVAFAAAEQ